MQLGGLPGRDGHPCCPQGLDRHSPQLSSRAQQEAPLTEKSPWPPGRHRSLGQGCWAGGAEDPWAGGVEEGATEAGRILGLSVKGASWDLLRPDP